MIRIASVAALLAVLCLVLWVPSAVPAERLMQIVRAEHAAHARLWGAPVAHRILERMLDFQDSGATVAVPPPATMRVGGPGVDPAMAGEFGRMNMRLFASPYLKGVDAMFSLAVFRAAALVDVLPLLLAFLAVCAVDGLAVRSVRAREFSTQSAEVYALSIASAIGLLALVVVTLFLPVVISPMHRIGALLLMVFVLSRAVANYHWIR